MTIRLPLPTGPRLAFSITLILMAAPGGMGLAEEKPAIDIGRQRELFLDDHLIDKLDGFVTVKAPMRGGEIVTRPLLFAAPEKIVPAPARPADPIVRTGEKPIIGKAALVFKDPAVLPIPDAQELGSQVTFAVHLSGISAMTGRRFFAAHEGGRLKEGDRKMVFDAAVYNAPDGPAICFIYSGIETSVPRNRVGSKLWVKKTPHHLAATWDDGEVTLYLDGEKVGTGGKKGAGALSLADPLRFGEGYPGPLHFDRPLAGDHHDAMVDDILVLRRVLGEEEIARIAKDGALAVVDPGKDEGVLYTMEEDPGDPGDDRRLKDHLPADGSSDTELPAGGIEWGEVQLLVNYATSAAGSVRCELQDEQGRPLPGFSLADSDLIYGDEIERPVSWRGRTELKSLVGKPVKLRFELKDADLYAIRFGQKP